MKKMLMAAVLMAVVGFSGVAGFGAGAEPVGISLLKIEYKKSLIQQDAAPKQTALRKKKLEELQAAGKTDEAADAEVDYIQAQGAEALVNLTVKELELQLKDAQAAASAPPMAPPGAPQPGGGAAGGPPQDQEPPASPTEIALLQLDLQKAQVQADVAKKVADNRQGVLTARQAKGAGGLEDAESDALGAATAARVAALDVEAAQMRVDAAVKSAAPKK